MFNTLVSKLFTFLLIRIYFMDIIFGQQLLQMMFIAEAKSIKSICIIVVTRILFAD